MLNSKKRDASRPTADIQTNRPIGRKTTGFDPSLCTMSDEQLEQLRTNTDFIEGRRPNRAAFHGSGYKCPEGQASMYWLFLLP